MRTGIAYFDLRGEEQRGEVKGTGVAARAGEEREGGQEGQMMIDCNCHKGNVLILLMFKFEIVLCFK